MDNREYFTDIPWSHSYFAELSPIQAEFSLTAAGLDFRPVKVACELGFGQGVALNIHSAAQPDITWWGNDFNPGHVEFAHRLAGASQTGVEIHLQSFQDFANRTDLPQFDFVGACGVWSWISHESREHILQFLDKHLRPGGVFFVNYLTLPGQGPMSALRKLLTMSDDFAGLSGTATSLKIPDVLQTVSEIIALNPYYVRMNPVLADTVKELADGNANHLAHEYFDRDWQPFYFSDAAREFSKAGLNWAGGADFIEQTDEFHLTPAQRDYLDGIEDLVFKNQIRDYLIDQKARWEYWVKGGKTLSEPARTERLRQFRFLLTSPKKDVSAKVNGGLGEFSLSKPAYSLILDILCDHQPHSFAEINEAADKTGVSSEHALLVLKVLLGSQFIRLVQSDNLAERARQTCRRVNMDIISDTLAGGDVKHFAAPVLGAGIGISPLEQLFISGLHNGCADGEQLAGHASDAIEHAKLCSNTSSDGGLLKIELTGAQIGKKAKEFLEFEWPALTAAGIE